MDRDLSLPPAYVITRAAPEHLSALADIELRAATLFHGWEVPPDVFVEATPPATLERALSRGHLWVALPPTGECVGSARFERSGERLHLEQLDVLPEHRGRGLGRALVGAIERWASENGVVELTLTTYRDVPWNAPFYMRLGFTVIEPAELDADLSARRALEIERGLDSMPRVALGKRLSRPASASS
jgi:GNAT superfamily N-acetyltransferase